VAKSAVYDCLVLYVVDILRLSACSSVQLRIRFIHFSVNSLRFEDNYVHNPPTFISFRRVSQLLILLGGLQVMRLSGSDRPLDLLTSRLLKNVHISV